MNPWHPISTWGEGDPFEVDLWLNVHASPRSFGISDAWRVIDCWRDSNKQWHDAKGELFQPYITHWMPVPPIPPPTESEIAQAEEILKKREP